MSTSLKTSLFLLARLSAAVAAIGLADSSARAHEWFWRDRVLPYPYAGRDPLDPGSSSSRLNYQPITRGLESYRPIDPLPWGDVNKRVTPNSGSMKGHQH
jgi:hypothetical protein